MKNIKLLNLHGENFKGFRTIDIDFENKTIIRGANATGKTSLLDLFWWVMVGKDSQGRTDFQIRPVNEYGEMVNNVDIIGEATMSVDGDVIVFRKVQSQVWTKKRGSTAPTFSGNQNTMTVNGFPVSQKEYEEKVSGILDEYLFKLMTNPMAFAMLPWKEQREILLRFVSDITDEDILALNESGFESVAKDILSAGAEAARNKAYARLKRLQEEQKTYPVRIDEAMRNKAPVQSEEEVLAKKAKAEADLDAIRKEMDDVSESLKACQAIQDEMVKVKVEMGEVKAKAEAYTLKAKSDARIAVTNAVSEVMLLEQKRDRLGDTLSDLTREIAENRAEMDELKKQYTVIQSRVMPKDETICPTCGREFDPDRIAEITSEFENRKSRDLGRIDSRGKALGAEVRAAKEKMARVQTELDASERQYRKSIEKRDELQEKANSIVTIDYTSLPEYLALDKRMGELNIALEKVDDGAELRGVLRGREQAARDILMMANGDLSVIEANRRLDARIEELKEQQRDCGQKVADAEEALYLIEGFIKLKMDTLTDRINEHFKNVRFKLFKTLINGSVQPTCVMQMASNGSYVDYPNLNHGAQIVAGLDVIEALQTLYDVSAPVWIDNAEALDGNHKPQMNSQLIMLEVSDDPELTVINS